MEWTKTSDQLPPEPKRAYSQHYLATVVNNQVVAVDYEKTQVRGKEVIRWLWNNRICPWDVIAWMPYPEAYKEENNNGTV